MNEEGKLASERERNQVVSLILGQLERIGNTLETLVDAERDRMLAREEDRIVIRAIAEKLGIELP